ncbi:MAG: alanine racemase [Advenella sp.]
MPRPIRAVISQQAMSHNLSVIRQYLGNARQAPAAATGGMQPAPMGATHIWAVIKANAYGHGLETAIGGFAQADGLAMLDLQETVRAREAGWQGPLLMLEGFFETRDLPELQKNRVVSTIHHPEQIRMLQASTLAAPLDVFLKINTGMNRLGFAPQQFDRAHQDLLALQQQGKVGRIGFMTHFADADGAQGAVDAPAKVFHDTIGQCQGSISLCNSAAVLRYPQLAVSAADNWVRPGICLYGSSPFANTTGQEFGLRQTMTLQARLLSIQHVKQGQTVGYGSIYTAARDMRIGVVACGYADGYPRSAPSGTPAWVNGVATQLAGRVSMDMLTIDLDPIPDAAVGDWVTLWGNEGPHIDEVAAAAGTIAYELLCALAQRVPIHVQYSGESVEK